MCFSLFCEVNKHNAGSDWTGEKNGHMQSKNMSINGGQSQHEWEHVPSVPDQAAIGQLHVSFEYHKMNLKIRVWQVSDLLLPPPQISMIDSFFVRSYLIPDTAKKTNRQTEAVRVELLSKDYAMPPQNGIQHIFSPSSFRFETPLLYVGVTQDIIAERSVRLEVWMMQKYTHKAFLMAMVHMPLRTAVRHPIREKYPLIPCMNYTIPNNMRVYSARDIIFDNGSSVDQSLTRSNSLHSSFSCPLTMRDVNLEDVEVENFIHRASLELTESDCDDDDVGSSIDIKSSLGKSMTSSTATVDVMSLSTDNEDTIGNLRDPVRLQNEVHHGVAADIGSEEKPKPKKKIIPNELLDKIYVSDVDISGIYKDDKSDVVSYLESNVPKEKDKDGTISPNPPSGRKKIIPLELLPTSDGTYRESQSQGNQNSNQGDVAHETFDNSCVYDDIQSSNKNDSPTNTLETTHPTVEETCQLEESRGNEDFHYKQHENQEDDITSEVTKSQHSLLEASHTGASSTPVSRPETPIWDFYDFTLEEGAERAENGNQAEAGSSKDEASTALGTLQESILRLSRASKTLDTCKVSGPVLPAVMIEDFEMDDDVDHDDTDDDDEN